MYFPFFILHDWDKRSAEARSSHCAVLPYVNRDGNVEVMPKKLESFSKEAEFCLE